MHHTSSGLICSLLYHKGAPGREKKTHLHKYELWWKVSWTTGLCVDEILLKMKNKAVHLLYYWLLIKQNIRLHTNTHNYTQVGGTYSRGTSTIRWTRLDSNSSRRSWPSVSAQGVWGSFYESYMADPCWSKSLRLCSCEPPTSLPLYPFPFIHISYWL